MYDSFKNQLNKISVNDYNVEFTTVVYIYNYRPLFVHKFDS